MRKLLLSLLLASWFVPNTRAVHFSIHTIDPDTFTFDLYWEPAWDPDRFWDFFAWHDLYTLEARVEPRPGQPDGSPYRIRVYGEYTPQPAEFWNMSFDVYFPKDPSLIFADAVFDFHGLTPTSLVPHQDGYGARLTFGVPDRGESATMLALAAAVGLGTRRILRNQRQ